MEQCNKHLSATEASSKVDVLKYQDIFTDTISGRKDCMELKIMTTTTKKLGCHDPAEDVSVQHEVFSLGGYDYIMGKTQPQTKGL